MIGASLVFRMYMANQDFRSIPTKPRPSGSTPKPPQRGPMGTSSQPKKSLHKVDKVTGLVSWGQYHTDANRPQDVKASLDTW